MSTLSRTFSWGVWFLGVAALLGSVAGAGWTIYSRAGDGAGGGAAVTPSAASANDRLIACLIGYIDVKEGLRPLYPVQTGRIDKVHVEEDQVVKAAEVLLTLDSSQAKILVREAQAALKIAEIGRDKASKLAAQLAAKEAQAQAAIDAAKGQFKAVEENYKRKKALDEKLQESDRGGHELAALKAQVDAAAAQVRVREGELAEVRASDPQIAVGEADAHIERYRAKLEEAQFAERECELRAPEDGLILRVFVGTGEVLGSQPKQPAILFCPNRPRIVRAELDQEYASRVQVGQLAIIEDDSRSGEEWRGVVKRIAPAYMQRRATTLEPFTLNDTRILECIVSIESNDKPMRLGQKVRVKLMDTKR